MGERGEVYKVHTGVHCVCVYLCVCVCVRERERVVSLVTISTVKMTVLPCYRTNSVSDLTPITTTRQVGKINVV